jgi:hypothetical protein
MTDESIVESPIERLKRIYGKVQSDGAVISIARNTKDLPCDRRKESSPNYSPSYAKSNVCPNLRVLYETHGMSGRYGEHQNTHDHR